MYKLMLMMYVAVKRSLWNEYLIGFFIIVVFYSYTQSFVDCIASRYRWYEDKTTKYDPLSLPICFNYILTSTILSHSARVVHSTSHSVVTLRERPTLGPYESFPDVLLRPGVRRTYLVRPIRTRRLFYVRDE